MKVVVAGGSGLIGGFLLSELEKDSNVDEIVALSRKHMTDVGKITWKKIDFDSISALTEALANVEMVYCALGTTRKKAGSEETFRKVDYTYVVNLAKAALGNGVPHFSVVSAVGASSESFVFYNRIKGEMEETLKDLGLKQLVIMQPSMLTGLRKETRIAEKLGLFVGSIASPFLVGALQKYKPIHAECVAKAMTAKSKSVKSGIHVLQYSDITQCSAYC